MPEWAQFLISIALGAGSGWITFRVRFERFEATDIAREEHRKEWRAGIVERLEKIESKPVNGYPVLNERVEKIERELGDRTHGIRGLLHAHSNYHTENDGRFIRIEEKLNLPPWIRLKRRMTDD